MKRIILWVLGFFLTTQLYSQQLKKFSSTPEEYFTQMQSFFESNGADSKENTKLIEAYKELWDKGLLTEDQKTALINSSNVLLAKRGKPNPHFLNYFKTILALNNSPKGNSIFATWDKVLNYLYAEKNVSLATADNFNNDITQLLTNNIISKSASAEWSFDNPSYELVFDKEPLLIFDKNIKLKCASKGDSAIIYNTHGTYNILKSQWTGSEGKVTWRRAGLGENSVYATLRNYSIDMKTAGYKADSVTFVNKVYYDKPLFGSLVEKVLADVTFDNASYPAFDSYDKLIEIKEIYPNVDYKGGFSMKGSKFLGSGNKEQDAILYFYRRDTVFLTCRSKIYAFRKDIAIGRNTSVTFKLGTDTIYHPGLLFKYNVKTREVDLVRDNDPQSMSPSPYFDTYHMLDMDFEQLNWFIDKDELKLGSLKGSVLHKASFESSNYFRESRYNEIQLNDEVHPLVALRKYGDKVQSKTFYADEFSNYLKKDLTQTHQLCLSLLYKGLIDYNINTDKITLKPRLFEYTRARAGKIDYDVINFNSEHDMVGLENANLNLNSFNLKLYGVQKIQVSDSQNVIIYPRGRQLVVKKNRNFIYDGIIEAGLFTFYGQDLSFDYDNFKIDMTNIDSLKIKVKSFKVDEYGQRNMVEVQNVIENVTGDLQIDDPHNKSSVKHFPKYPIFNSKKPSFVYYDYHRTQDGVYNKDKFFFEIDPYTIDSLNSFTTEGLTFNGNFTSADIFEPFREQLKVQEDYSLGFTRYTTPAGYPIYKGKGTFIDTMNLSNKGLLGRGTLNYLNTTTTSRMFVFLPDSMHSIATTYEIRKQTKQQGVEYPQVNAQHIYTHWEPYHDKFNTRQLDSAIYMYDKQAKLMGGTSFTPKGLSGWGEFIFGNARITSNGFSFLEHETNADTAKFDLLVVGAKNEFAFKTKNVSAHVDFNEKKATFKSNDKMTVVQFPQNKYICYLNKFSWDMVTEQMELGSDESNKEDLAQGKVPGLRFISVHPKQDTLNFIAPVARYDLKNYIINARQVKYINVADAIVYPGEDGKVTIQKNAVMETLKDAKIVANAKSRYHTIYNATLDIGGRLKYTGSGKYDYVNSTNKKQTILLNLINVDSAYRTYATGEIAPQDSFTLSPEYKFQGKVRLYAPNQFLNFDGSAFIDHECDTMQRYWFKFKSDINPLDMYIDIDSSLKDISNNKLYNGIFMTKDSIHIYSAFLAKRKSFNDKPIISAWGVLHYDKEKNRYEIGPKEKLLDKTAPGNYLWFHRKYCQMYGEGKLDFAVDLGQVKLNTYGTISHNIPMNKVSIEAVMFVDFFFPPNLLGNMADTITNNTTLSALNFTSPVYTMALTNVLGQKRAKEIATELQLYKTVKKIPEEFNHTISFTQLDMKWDPTTRSYKSIGKIGVGNILNRPLNKLVKGYIEISRKRSGDAISIYLEISDKTWYFFNYTKEQMQAISSEAFFNAVLQTIKADKRKLKVARKEAQYEFFLSTEAKKNMFVSNFIEGKAESESTDSTNQQINALPIQDSTKSVPQENITPQQESQQEPNIKPNDTTIITKPVTEPQQPAKPAPTQTQAPAQPEPAPANATTTPQQESKPANTEKDKEKDKEDAEQLKREQAAKDKEDAERLKREQAEKDKQLQKNKLRDDSAPVEEEEEEVK